jgi:hypothetical protein
MIDETVLAHIVAANGGVDVWEIDFRTTIEDTGEIYQPWKDTNEKHTLTIIYTPEEAIRMIELVVVAGRDSYDEELAKTENAPTDNP